MAPPRAGGYDFTVDDDGKTVGFHAEDVIMVIRKVTDGEWIVTHFRDEASGHHNFGFRGLGGKFEEALQKVGLTPLNSVKGLGKLPPSNFYTLSSSKPEFVALMKEVVLMHITMPVVPTPGSGFDTIKPPEKPKAPPVPPKDTANWGDW